MKLFCVVLLAAGPLLAQSGAPVGTASVNLARDVFEVYRGPGK